MKFLNVYIPEKKVPPSFMELTMLDVDYEVSKSSDSFIFVYTFRHKGLTFKLKIHALELKSIENLKLIEDKICSRVIATFNLYDAYEKLKKDLKKGVVNCNV